MPGSVSTNRHVCSKRYEPSNVYVRCGTHIFIHLRILWIPKSQLEDIVATQEVRMIPCIHNSQLFFICLSNVQFRTILIEESCQVQGCEIEQHLLLPSLEIETIDNGEQLFMGNSSSSKVEGQRKVVLKMTSGKELTLNDVLHVPEIRKNLVFGSLLSKKGFKLVFVPDNFILSKNGMYVGKGYMSNGLFKMNVMTVVPPIKNINKNNTSSTYMLESSNVWHGRLGHVNYDTLRRLLNMECLPNFKIDPNHKCEICVESKLIRTSFQSIERSSEPLELIHSDICDLKFIQTRGGKKYFLTLIDDCIRYCYVYLLRSKDEALEMFQHFKNEVENQLDRKIKVIRSDRGGEYEAPFGDFCSQHGIIHQTTAPYSPQQNGVAERKNRTLKEMMNALLLSSGLPQNLWGEAILSANYILHRIPHKKTNKSPYELWKGRRPS